MSDEHSPQIGCKYNACGKDDEYNCPFNRNFGAIPGVVLPSVELPGCKHEWRQLSLNSYESAPTYVFYCIHDPEHRKNLLEHDSEGLTGVERPPKRKT